MILVWLITTAIGFAGPSHGVLGTVEVLASVFSGQGETLTSFGRFLLWTTVGNIDGGTLFVALIKFGHAKPQGEQA